MKTLTELETDLKKLQAECNQDFYHLGVKQYALEKLPEEIEELATRIFNKNVMGEKIQKEMKALKETPATPEVTQ